MSTAPSCAKHDGSCASCAWTTCASVEFSFTFKDGEAAKAFALMAARAGCHVEFAERMGLPGRWDVTASTLTPLRTGAAAQLGAALGDLARAHEGRPEMSFAFAA